MMGRDDRTRNVTGQIGPANTDVDAHTCSTNIELIPEPSLLMSAHSTEVENNKYNPIPSPVPVICIEA